MTAVSTVSSAITVDAVLLPRAITRRLFGNEIAKRFAAVQMTVSNRSSSAGLILHSVLLDYSQWLFSGNFTAAGMSPQPVATADFQQQNKASQVASAEARLVRGDLQDAQNWTTRNWFIRAATLVGTGASAFSFVTADAATLAGISAYGNQIVPALNVFWPDNTQAQINRISDFGFQDNRVIAKNSSDTIVAFFPLDRFLTTNLQKIYLKEPAAFFVPTELLLDPKGRKTLLKPLQSAGIVDPNDQIAAAEIVQALTDYQKCTFLPVQAASGGDPTTAAAETQGECIGKLKTGTLNSQQAASSGAKGGSSNTKSYPFDELLIVHTLDRVSLNNIRIVIGGAMTVDVNTVPAAITGVTFADAGAAAAWTDTAGTHSATISGSFLSDGKVTLTGDAATYFAQPVTVDTKNSSDTSLRFTFKLASAVPASCKALTVTVTKSAQDNSSNASVPRTVALQTTAPACPTAQ